jgi:hypothetical protein
LGGLGELGGWFNEWGKDIIGQGFDFGKTFIGAKYGKDAAKFQASGYPPTGGPSYAAQPTVPPGYVPVNAADEYGSGGVSGAGIRIGGTLITWPTVALGVGVLVLLQSKGFERKR